jgi:mannosyltransferase
VKMNTTTTEPSICRSCATKTGGASQGRVALGMRQIAWARLPWGLLAALGIALAFRLPYLGTRSVWYDEASSWQTARFPLTEILGSLRWSVHPPLYFWVLKAWMAAFGESALSLRGLSVLFGLLAVLGIYLVAKECSDGLAKSQGAAGPSFLPVSAALLVAVNAFQISASIEIRMYSLGTALTAFSTWGLLKALADPASLKRWTVYVGLCLLLVSTHHYCLFVAGSQFAFLLGYSLWQALRRGRQEARLLLNSAVAVGIILLVYVPGLVLMLAQLGRVRQDFSVPPFNLQLVAQSFGEFISPVAGPSGTALLATISLGLFGSAAVVVAYRARKVEMLVVTLAILPMVFAAGVTLFLTPIWLGRFFRFSQLFLLLLLPLAVAKVFRWPWLRIVATGGIVLGMGAASIDFWENRQIATHPGMRGAMERILSLHNGRDPIVAVSKIHYFPAKYYTPSRIRIRVMESVSRTFWVNHLLRRADIISNEDFRDSLPQGIWLLSHSPVPCGIEDLFEAVVDESFEAPYDHGVLPWTVFVAHVRLPDEAARVENAMERVRLGLSEGLDLTAVKDLDGYLPEVIRLSSLESLRLDATSMNDGQLHMLSACERLSFLSLVNTEVTDRGMNALRGLQGLSTLKLDFTAVGDGGARVIADLPNLRELSLQETQVTDSAVRHLANARELRRLHLGGTAITDQGLLDLARFANLEELDISDTRITSAAVENLQRTMPGLRICRD